MKTIILDEVTAFLNPISQKRLINGLWDLGEDITLITHSPVTVSLFNRAEFKLVGNGSIKSVNTREAMSILLKDTPDLVVKDVGDINVFAEAKNDAKFYAWQIKGSDQNLNISSISTQKIKDDSIIEVDGGTTQIDNITKSLIGLETLSIAFIKDFDGVNKTDKKKRVFVNDERYSLENYIFDPYLVGFILGEDHTEKFNQIFEGDSKETEYEVDGQIIKKKLPKTFTDVKIKDSLWLKYCHDIGYRPLEDFNKLRAASFYFKSIQLLFKDIS